MAVIKLNSLLIELLKAKEKANTEQIKSESMLSLISLIDKKARSYDDTKWRQMVSNGVSLEEIYNSFSKSLCSYKEKMIFFLMLDYLESSIVNYEPFIIIPIVEATAISEIDPNEYYDYWDMLLSQEICPLIRKIGVALFPIVILELMRQISLEDLRNKNYSNIIKLLSRASGVRHSPFFKGDFSVENIYRVLFETMTTIETQTTAAVFSTSDYSTLEILKNEEMRSSKEMQLKLRKIEDENGQDRLEFCRKSLKAIRAIWAKAKGISLVITTKNKGH